MSSLSRADKLELLEDLSRELENPAEPAIQKTPGVCGGAACIRNLRLAVWMLEEARRKGATEAELLADYPSLRAEDLTDAWIYARSHRDEIDASLEENEMSQLIK